MLPPTYSMFRNYGTQIVLTHFAREEVKGKGLHMVVEDRILPTNIWIEHRHIEGEELRGRVACLTVRRNALLVWTAWPQPDMRSGHRGLGAGYYYLSLCIWLAWNWQLSLRLMSVMRVCGTQLCHQCTLCARQHVFTVFYTNAVWKVKLYLVIHVFVRRYYGKWLLLCSAIM